MDSVGESGDLFATPDLWRPSTLARGGFDDPKHFPTALDDIGPLEDVHTRFPPLKGPELEFTDPFRLGSLETIEILAESVESSDVGYDEPFIDQDEDIWWIGDSVEPQGNKIVHRSWDTFGDNADDEPCSAYLSDGRPQAFDSALRLQSRNTSGKDAPSNVVHYEVLTTCLFNLAQGNSSILFRYLDTNEGFQPAIPNLKVPGYSVQTVKSLTTRFVEYGNITRYLKAFVNQGQAQKLCRSSRSALVALADTVSTTLSALQVRLSNSPASLQSLLQLQALCNPHGRILECINEIVSSVATTKSDDDLLSRLFESVQQREYAGPWLRQILFEIFARVSLPWLDFVTDWIGLRTEFQAWSLLKEQSRSFVSVDVKPWVDEAGVKTSRVDYVFDYSKVPSFVLGEDARMIFETGKSLRLLQSHHPDHPLARPEASSNSESPQLAWTSSWADIERIIARAREYERSIAAAVQEYSLHGHRPKKSSIYDCTPSAHAFDLFGRTEQDLKKYIAASTAVLDQEFPAAANVGSKRDLHDLILQAVVGTEGRILDDATTFAPPLSLASQLSFGPILSAQARLVNSACIRLFFKEHHLRSHLSLQRRFHLIGDGVFASRISHALFDPDLETTERGQGFVPTGAGQGLRLGSRENWPPASSELRLALMGILTDCYHSAPGTEYKDGILGHKRELPGGLSFAVRNISEEELEKCMNSHSLEALDFLRLQYKPPPPLEAIITPDCLYKYDRLFKHLLRAMRMLYVVTQLFKDAAERTSHWQGVDAVARKFRIEAHHFVSSVSGYFFEVGVGVTWQKFEDKLDEIESRIDSEDTEGSLGDTEGLHKLQEYHERVLDRIMFATLLRNRQEPVLRLLEDIFSLILTFARYSRGRTCGKRIESEDGEEIKQVYSQFRKKTAVFVSVCRGLSEKKGYGAKKGVILDGEHGLFESDDLNEGGENSIGQLLLRLEMTDYYLRNL